MAATHGVPEPGLVDDKEHPRTQIHLDFLSNAMLLHLGKILPYFSGKLGGLVLLVICYIGLAFLMLDSIALVSLSLFVNLEVVETRRVLWHQVIDRRGDRYNDCEGGGGGGGGGGGMGARAAQSVVGGSTDAVGRSLERRRRRRRRS